MKKLLLVISILGGGAVSFAALHRTANRAQAMGQAYETELGAHTNRMTELEQTNALLRAEIVNYQAQWRRATAGPSGSPEPSVGTEDLGFEADAATRTEWRQHYDIGWDSSADYVLVSKRVLKGLPLQPFDFNGRLTGTVREVLAVSAEEQAQLNTTRQWVRAEVLASVERTEPVGDIVAQYSFRADAALEQSISNHFSASLTSALGPQRAELFLDQAWRDLRGKLPATREDIVTLTIRRSGSVEEPTLSCELKQGGTSHSAPVHYGHYPSPWFGLLFPGGWRELAQREGFELPRDFQKR